MNFLNLAVILVKPTVVNLLKPYLVNFNRPGMVNIIREEMVFFTSFSSLMLKIIIFHIQLEILSTVNHLIFSLFHNLVVHIGLQNTYNPLNQ